MQPCQNPPNTEILTGCVEDGTKAVSEKDGTNLVFTFPDSWNALPKVVEMQVSGLDVLEGNSYVNNNVPGYEFG